ncbi:hypothetical protein [Pseudomonas sp. 6D_7.1_Bac1]|uniref:hypothetical protein n=1 Tax=Pseudomonas sp. 6D_7.1_Bac1 TaxID=2971615 RepID=UPI0021C80E1C|nr:hypothetical protein [Pseudomonas sp. 6D_7.1_Bac1]MCU1749579.1 hypothetical protein [Pseudomonas sp. 6D_7.1_Bac1]
MTSLSANANSSKQTLIFSTDSSGTGVLAVSPPLLLGGKPLPNNAVGANRNMVNSDRRGLLFYIFPYLNMSGTDHINVYLGTRPTPVASFNVDVYVDQLVPFYILASVLEQMYATPTPLPNILPLHFTVDRISGNPEKSDPPLPLLYKPFGPGELDTRPDLPNNQGLPLPVPSETIIDQTVINDGMFVTVPQYEHQAVGDVVYLAVGPLILEMTVAALGDLLFELTPAFLATLPNTDRVFISYEIVDIVQNESGWSTSVMLSLKPTVALLVAPDVSEADQSYNVDYDSLAGAGATVFITGVFNAGDIVVLTLVLFTLAGDRVERAITRDVTAATRLLLIPLENEFVRNGIRGSMILSYTQQSSVALYSSKSRTITISGLALAAPAPTVTEAVAGVLPADTQLAEVLIPHYWPLALGATVRMSWQVTGKNGVVHLYVFEQIITNIALPIAFLVASEYIEQFAGNPLTVRYVIENPGSSALTSEFLTLQVGPGSTGWVDSNTDFQDDTYGGWERGSAAGGSYIRIWSDGVRFFYNPNNVPSAGGLYSGVVLQQTFLFPVGNYRFRIQAVNHTEGVQGPDIPILALYQDRTIIASAVKFEIGGPWLMIEGTFTVNTRQSSTLYVMSEQIKGNGNNCAIGQLEVQKIG